MIRAVILGVAAALLTACVSTLRMQCVTDPETGIMSCETTGGVIRQ